MPGKKSEIIKKFDKQAKNLIQPNIVKIRNKNGLSQQLVADALGITRGTYSNYESRTLPPQYLIIRLAEIYKVSPDVFYKADDDIVEVSCDEKSFGDSMLSELSDREKLIIMRFRQLSSSDKEDVATMINNKLTKAE